ncbi:MAG: class I SAM-dependent methyltransferase [Magnetococcales bacterium]|nr:class I SAM-dependent methyltransferase [Magnetococcales bacterium]
MAGQKDKSNREYYNSARVEMLSLIPQGSRRILDVGCGAGELGKGCKELCGAEYVVGIEYNKQAAELAQNSLDKVIQGDVETLELPFAQGFFDCIIYADILEHLINPDVVLKKHVAHLAPNGKIVASIPNVRYFAVLSQLVDGHWTYEEQGILDRDHLRFFTLKEMLALFADAGLKPGFIGDNVKDLYNKLKPDEFPADLRLGRLTISGLSEQEFRDLFVFQYLLVMERG